MYIQITDHCNMTCAHCCFSCSPRKKRFMTHDIFKKTLKFADSYVAIGGGEPTCHPDFWSFMGLSIGDMNIENVLVITNGKRTSDALALLRLCDSEVFSVELSIDDYHDQIEDMVKKRFTEHNRIRTVRRIVPSGRAKRNYLWIDNGCCCDDLFVDPVGDVFSCGCRKHKFGNVSDGIDTFEIQGWYDGHNVGFGECVFTKR